MTFRQSLLMLRTNRCLAWRFLQPCFKQRWSKVMLFSQVNNIRSTIEEFREHRTALTKQQRINLTVQQILEKEIVSQPSERLESTVEILINNHIQKADILKLFMEISNGYLCYAPSKWEKTLRPLQNAGFNSNQICALMRSFHPVLFSCCPLALENTFNALLALSFRTTQLYKLCSANSELFVTTGQEIEAQFNDLLQIFSRKEVIKLLLSNPGMLTSTFSEICAKAEYVVDEMGLQKSDMVNCTLFNQSLLHIKTRHSLLTKVGLYERPNKQGATSKVENPSLRCIVDSDDRYFCNKVAFIPAAECKAYSHMMEIRDIHEEETDDELS